MFANNFILQIYERMGADKYEAAKLASNLKNL